jgi:elongation factor Ts
MAISASDVSALRQQTGAGMMDCKKALEEAAGDIAKATEILMKKGIVKAAERAGRIATEGAVGSYIHGGRIGVLVEVNCETDFVARTEEFKALVKDIAMHIAAADPRPQYVEETEIPEAQIAKQREIYAALPDVQGKPANIQERIVEGKIAKWKKELCLLDQPFVKDPDSTVRDFVVKTAASAIKENVKVRRFVRFELGEGLEKKSSDFAAEVAAAAGQA